MQMRNGEIIWPSQQNFQVSQATTEQQQSFISASIDDRICMHKLTATCCRYSFICTQMARGIIVPEYNITNLQN
jgi:hypothetical protein